MNMSLSLIFISSLISVCDPVMGDNGEMVRKELCTIRGVALNLEKFLTIKKSLTVIEYLATADWMKKWVML